MLIGNPNMGADLLSFTISEPDSIKIELTPNDESCFGINDGSITVVQTSGNPITNYNWSSSGNGSATENGLAQGTYTVTVSDTNGCTVSAESSVGGALEIQFTAIPQNEQCFGANDGKGFLTITDGSGPFSIDWNDPAGQTGSPAINLAPGVYTATITDGNTCTSTANLTIAPAIEILLSTTTTPVNCLGGSDGMAEATVSGGEPPYFYSWSDDDAQDTPIALNLPTGTYTVTITDKNSCTATTTATVGSPTESITVFLDQTLIACNGSDLSEAQVTTTGATGNVTYNWSGGLSDGPDQSNLIPGDYTVTVIDDNGCRDSTSITIIEHPEMSLTGTTSAASCGGNADGTAEITSVTGGGGNSLTLADYSYAWSTTPTQTGVQATGLGAGDYTVTVTDVDGCSGTTILTVGQPSSLSITTGENVIDCPNDGNSFVFVVPNAGTPPYEFLWDSGSGDLTNDTLFNVIPGDYTVTVSDANGCSISASASITPLPILEITNLSEVCDVANLNYTVSFDLTGGNGTYTIDGNSLSGTSFVSNPIPAGSSYSFSIDDDLGCGPILLEGAVLCQPTSCFPGCFGPNLVTNGDFESGNTGFNSDYNFSSCPGSCTNTTTGASILCQYDYSIGTNAQDCNPDWIPTGDHSSGAGNMMIIDFPDSDVSPNNKIWCQTITVNPNTDFCLGAYFLNLLPNGTGSPAPVFEFMVNGSIIGTTPAIQETGNGNSKDSNSIVQPIRVLKFVS